MADSPEDLPPVKFAEFPDRSCREPQTPDGLIDHFCGLKEWHAGPHCPPTLPEAVRRRQEWERDHPGWERMEESAFADPFADLTSPQEAADDSRTQRAPGPDANPPDPRPRERRSRAARAADQAGKA